MRTINIANEKKRDAAVSFDIKKPERRVEFFLKDGSPRKSIKILKTTIEQDLPALLQKYGSLEKIAAEIAQDCMIELFRRWETVHHPRSYAYRVGGRMWARRMTNARMETLVAELPEPTSLAVKGLGAVSLHRCRRK